MSFFFIQMSDPQFGLFAHAYKKYKNPRVIKLLGKPPGDGFPETHLYQQAIDISNRLNPAFVVITGDLVQDPLNLDQYQEFTRISETLNEEIPMYLLPGNCDVGEQPTHNLIGLYRDRFGADNYSFDHQGVHFLGLNSATIFDPLLVPNEWENQKKFISMDLESAKNSKEIIAFMHHPLFGSSSDEEDSHFVLPRERRLFLLEQFEKYSVNTVFSGHWHRNNETSDGRLQVITTSAVGFPLGDDPSGLRIVYIKDGVISHKYYGFDQVPERIDIEKI